jgi:hypothetical protein
MFFMRHSLEDVFYESKYVIQTFLKSRCVQLVALFFQRKLNGLNKRKHGNKNLKRYIVLVPRKLMQAPIMHLFS